MQNIANYSHFVMAAYVVNDLAMSGFALYVLYQYFSLKKKSDVK